jgi:hypothetical protein
VEAARDDGGGRDPAPPEARRGHLGAGTRAPPAPHLRRDSAHPCDICAGNGLALTHPRQDWAHPCDICAGTGPTTTASASGLGSPLPHLRGDRDPPLPLAGHAAAAVAGAPAVASLREGARSYER